MSGRPVRIGVQYLPQHSATYGPIRDAVLRGEEAGVDIAFNWDHFYPLSGDPDGYHFECWTMLAAWAEQTERIEFGPLVSCNSYRNPELLADMVRTIDHISAKGDEGRVILGIGSGWFERDYVEYGYEFGTVGSRLDDLAESLPRIESRFAKLHPAATRDVPIMVGGSGERKTLRLVAEHADIWHTMYDPEVFSRKLDVLKRWCDDVGREFADIEISVGRWAFQGFDRELLDEAYAKGVRLFTLGADGPDYVANDLDAYLAWRDEKNE
ncbi:MAG TPA: LLM class F420-dependent oxidoreductase [Microbacteriaceae bacterium]|nr:LLM class F420-dependent oxidoreductase [Microbacteriaceae bacterium]